MVKAMGREQVTTHSELRLSSVSKEAASKAAALAASLTK